MAPNNTDAARGRRRGREERGEVAARTIAVYGRHCIGCVDHDADLMLSVLHRGVHPIHGASFIVDLFITRAQAAELIAKLAAALARESE